MQSFKSKVILIIATILIFGMVEKGYGQDDKKTPAPKSAGKTAKELEKKEWERKRAEKRAHDKALKAHMKHQTKDVRKRMKKDAKIAKQHNDGA